MIGNEIPVHNQMVRLTLWRKEHGVSDQEIRATAARLWVMPPESIEAILQEAGVAR